MTEKVSAEDYNALNPVVRANPYPYYAALREESPVHQMMPGAPLFAVSRHADVQHILHHPERNDWWFHNGAVGGFVSSVTFDPKEKIGVVVLSNVSAFNPKMNGIDQLCFALMSKQLEP